MAKSKRRGAKRQRLLDGSCHTPSPEFQPCPSANQPLSAVSQITCGPHEKNSDLVETSFEADLESGSNDLVCFGMVTSIAARCEQHHSLADAFPVDLDSSTRFHIQQSKLVSGVILPHHGQMIEGLLNEEKLVLHVSCSPEPTLKARRSASSYSQVSCTLEITVYGPFELFDELGDWFQEYNVYLQDPRLCHLDVRYCNPQRLSSHDLQSSPFLSQVVARASASLSFQEIEERADLLDAISGQEDLIETPSPTSVKTSLHRHQRQALTFMLRREKGWVPGDAWLDMWEISDATHSRYYINRVTDKHQKEAPSYCHGGIIADPMGLGKTLTMIALIATDITTDREQVHHDWESFRPARATLVIVPQPLLNSWEEQITDHLIEGSIRVVRHHGKGRLSSLQELDATDIVLTTYHTVSADWKASKADTGGHMIFSVRWKRIVLDEAHLVRNMKTRMARAICELAAESRWAVTGTPIQNHLTDLAALLKFIRAHPYDDPKRFDTDIPRLWKAGEDKEAVQRLKRLAHCLILRRAKKTIALPTRRDMKCPVDFNTGERTLYNNVREQTITRIDDALLHDAELSRSGIYVNFLQQIESMRLICNLGLHYHERHDKIPSQDAAHWESAAQEAFNIQREMNIITCVQCSLSLEMTDNFVDDSVVQENPQFSRCSKFACSECCYKNRITGHKMVCGHTPRCPIAPISISNSAFEEIFSQESSPKMRPTTSFAVPSKVKALISDLKSQESNVKSIVFSTWRLTLDLIDASLNQAGISSVRFDGKVSQTQRKPVLGRFKNDPDVRVMLLTLQCGAVGLTLTEASRAYLMEPHWNPTIEEQALARIHRIGQAREVTTVRFYIRDSFEERVMEVQESKKNLAGVLLSGHDGGQADDSLGALQRLRSLL